MEYLYQSSFYDIIVIDGRWFSITSYICTWPLCTQHVRPRTPVNHRKIVMEKVGLLSKILQNGMIRKQNYFLWPIRVYQ